MKLFRREFLKSATVVVGATVATRSVTAKADSDETGAKKGDANLMDGAAEYLRNARFLGDRFVAWQAPYGGPDPKRSPYRSGSTATIIQGVGPQVRALYRLFEATGVETYKHAADRHAVFMLNTIHDPWKPYSSVLNVTGKPQFAVSAAWIYGKGLSPCYQWFRRQNPNEDSFDLKAHAMYRWLQFHRRDDSYFGVGYPIPGFDDAQFSCDLGEVGSGLVGFYQASQHEPALRDALELASYFLTEHEPGNAKGVWSSEKGTWLVGPWPGGGAEHFTNQKYNEVGWGWSCLVDSEFLLELRRLPAAESLRAAIDEKCVRAFRWCMDNCQFDDGAHGMFGRDDKWVGQGAAAVLLYAKLREQDLIPAAIAKEYEPKIRRSWDYLVQHTSDRTFPEHGYTRVTGKTTINPPENLLWMMAWTLESLLIGGPLFASA